MSASRRNWSWRRKAAIFAAAASAFTGLGVIIILLATAKDPDHAGYRVAPTPSSVRASPTP